MSTTKYSSIVINFNDLGGKNTFKKLKVIKEGYTLYFNCQHLMAQLGTESRCFFDYLCERMNSNSNEVKIDQEFKRDFVSHISKITSTKTKPSIHSLNKYVSTFKKLGLIIPTLQTERGYYSVNPRYAYKGQKKDRLQLLGEMITKRIQNRQSLKGLIDSPEHELGITYDG